MSPRDPIPLFELPAVVSGTTDFLDSLAAGYTECGCNHPEMGLLLAVSGGADSVALLHGTNQLWPQPNKQIVVAHVNHQLRGPAGRADAEFVKDAAQALGLQFVMLTCDVATERDTEGGSTEEVARKHRYELLSQTAERMKLNAVVCGHHQNDQAETVLHNILRGTGLRGVSGMTATRPLTDTVQLMRPMLRIARTTAENWLSDQELTSCIDESNSSPEFTRNRIRNELLPLLAESYNPQVVASLLRLAGHARDAESLSDEVAQRCLDDVILELQPGACRIDRGRLASWPELVVRSALRQIWSQQGWPQQRMNKAHWDHLAADLQNEDAKPQDIPGIDVSVTETIVRIFRMG